MIVDVDAILFQLKSTEASIEYIYYVIGTARKRIGELTHEFPNAISG